MYLYSICLPFHSPGCPMLTLPTPWPTPWPRSLQQYFPSAPSLQPLTELVSWAISPATLSHLAALRDTGGPGGWFQAQKNGRYTTQPPSYGHVYRDQMTINQWIFRETLLTKPQRPQKRSGKSSTGCAFKSLGFQGDLKHLISIFSCHNEAFASGDFLDASWRNVLEETTSYPLHFEKVYNIPRISLVTST